MQIYYSSLEAIQQQTRQLEHERCHHCDRTQHLVSHGFVRKKERAGALPAVVGKRGFCSNRYRRSGCGRTMQLYLDATLRCLHYAAGAMEAFLLAWLAGSTVQRAYRQATGTVVSRNAYRWLNRLVAQLSAYRSVFHQPSLADDPPSADSQRSLRRRLFAATITRLLQQLGAPLCAGFQLKWQRAFL